MSTSESLNITALRDLFDALSTQRSKKFCLMAEDELLNLYRSYKETTGTMVKVTFPPLSENLRDLISMIASRFAMKVTVLPEGEQEKPTMVEFHKNTVLPTLMLTDLFPRTCALDARASMHTGSPKEAETIAQVHAQQTAKPPPAEHGQAEDPGAQASEMPIKKDTGTSKARPSMGVYRPRGSLQARETLEQGAASAPPHAETSKSSPTRGAAPASQADSVDDENDECELLHDYASFRIDLTVTRAWDELPRRRAYTELAARDASAGNKVHQKEDAAPDPPVPAAGVQCDWSAMAGARFAWEASWQLRRSGNGSVSFTVQPQSSAPALLLLALRGAGGSSPPLIVSVDPIARRCAIACSRGGAEVACAEGVAAVELRRGAAAPGAGARPPPEAFWVAVRDGVAAVGSGSRVSGATVVAALRCEEARALRDVGFATAGAALSLSRIAVGKPLAPVLPSVAHVVAVVATGAMSEARRAPPLPRPVRAAWQRLPSVVTWAGGGGAAGGSAPQAFAHPALARLSAVCPAVRVAAADADSGWAVFPSEEAAAMALQAVGAPAGAAAAAADAAAAGGESGGTVGSAAPGDDAGGPAGAPAALKLAQCASASRKMLAAAGLPVARDRRAASTASASRLISQALRQARPGSARSGR